MLILIIFNLLRGCHTVKYSVTKNISHIFHPLCTLFVFRTARVCFETCPFVLCFTEQDQHDI